MGERCSTGCSIRWRDETPVKKCRPSVRDRTDAGPIRSQDAAGEPGGVSFDTRGLHADAVAVFQFAEDARACRAPPQGAAAMTDRSHEIPQGEGDLRNLARVVSACTLGLWAFAIGLLIGVFLFS